MKANPSDELQIKKVTLYKNDLGFFERQSDFQPSSNDAVASYEFSMYIPTESKPLVVDTLSVKSPGLVTVNYDVEKN